MASKTTFNLISKELIKQTGRCELCGSKRGLEVHHIIPRCAAIPNSNLDLDDEDNLIVVCSACHARLTPRRMLTRYGIANMCPSNGTKQSWNAMKRFYKIIDDLDCRVDINDMFDIVELVFADYLTVEQKQERKDRLGL